MLVRPLGRAPAPEAFEPQQYPEIMCTKVGGRRSRLQLANFWAQNTSLRSSAASTTQSLCWLRARVQMCYNCTDCTLPHDYCFRHATLLAIMSLRSSYLLLFTYSRKDKFCHVTTCRKRVSKKAPGQEVHRNLSQPIWSPILSVHSGPCLHRCLPAGPGLTQGVAIALCAAPRCSSVTPCWHLCAEKRCRKRLQELLPSCKLKNQNRKLHLKNCSMKLSNFGLSGPQVSCPTHRLVSPCHSGWIGPSTTKDHLRYPRKSSMRT